MRAMGWVNKMRWCVILVLLLLGPVTGFRLTDLAWKPLGRLSDRTRRLGGAKRLWIVQTRTPPDEPLGYLGQGSYIVRAAAPEGWEGSYAHLAPELKFPADINATFGVILKLVTAQKSHARLKHLRLDETKGYVRGPLTREDVRELAASENVLWVSARKPHKRHALASRLVLMGSGIGSAQQGVGGRLLVSDTGLDTTHCMFSDGSAVPVAVLPITGALPQFNGTGKVLGIMPIEYAPGRVTNYLPYADAHGTSTAGVAAGYACGGNSGVAPAARFLFLDMTYRGDSLATPPSWARAFAVAAAHNISVHTASWGGTIGDGVYDGQAHEFDEYARLYDLLHVISAGNDGPFLVASPATAKNALSVGAAMGGSFPHFDAGQQSAAPLLYDLTTGANFTSRGPKIGGSRAPLVFAPGVSVQVAYALAEGTAGHDDYVYEDGTSFAAPAVAGAALAIDEFFINTTGTRASAAMKMAALIVGARPVARFVGISTTTVALDASAPADISYGVPLVQVADTLMVDRQATSGDRAAFCFTATDTTVSVALAWLDLAAYPHVLPLLINDLDLLASVNGTEITLNNHLDTTEALTFAAGVGMTVRLVVSVTGALSGGAQNYSVAVVGAAPSGAPCGTCLAADRTGCTTGEVPVCNGDTGAASCAVASCPSGYIFNGTACAVAPDGSVACDIAHGSGLLVASLCLVQHCDANYVASNGGTQCSCLEAMECGDDVVVVCINNAFMSCSDARAQSFPAQAAQGQPDDDALSANALLFYGLATAFIALVLAALICLCIMQAVDDAAQPTAGLRPEKHYKIW